MTSARGHGVIVYCLNSGTDDIQMGRHNGVKKNFGFASSCYPAPPLFGFPSHVDFRPSFAIHSEQKRSLVVARHRSYFRSFRRRKKLEKGARPWIEKKEKALPWIEKA
ncbi:hypothetical protein TNCV_3311301 [Trichonephila clavipes]|nr:hypothetical protein TNCV_3311301 [Trichonephila clavipes]